MSQSLIAEMRTLLDLQKQRRDYVEHLIECADTVTLLRGDEIADLHRRADAGEFDGELAWRSPFLNAGKP